MAATVLIVDDHANFRSFARALLEAEGLDVVGEAADGSSALSLVRALENERLQAEAHAQLEDLRSSRTRIIEAGDAESRRLERDLHDGAQQRLVALSLALRSYAADSDRITSGNSRFLTRPRASCGRRSPSCESSRTGSTLPSSATKVWRRHSRLWRRTGGRGCELVPSRRSGSRRPSRPRHISWLPKPRGRRRHRRRDPTRRKARGRRRSGGRAWRARRPRGSRRRPRRPTRRPRPPTRRRAHLRRSQDPGGDPMRLVVADDSMLLREGLARLLADAGFAVVGKAENASELMRRVELTRPDVAI